MDTIVRWKPIICEETISESFFDSELNSWHLKFGSEKKATADFILDLCNQKIDSIKKTDLEFTVRYGLLTITHWEMKSMIK
ncbi:MAG: hypothetical protein ACK4E0_06485 [Chitinophagaceae bacterium]